VEIPEEIEGDSEESIIDDGDDPVAELLASTSIPGRDALGTEQNPDIYGQQSHTATTEHLTLGKTKHHVINLID
jgi:hypothetical protein